MGRFITLPTIVFNAQQNELMGKDETECEQVKTFKKISPLRIESYEPAMPLGGGFGEDKQTATQITMYSGETFVSFIHIDEFEKILENYDK